MKKLNKCKLLILSIFLLGILPSKKIFADNYISIHSSVSDNRESDGATGENSIAIGPNSKSEGKSSVSIGDNANTKNRSSIAIGHNVKATTHDSIVIGRDMLRTDGFNTILIGTKNTVFGGTNQISIGNNSLIGIESITIGSNNVAVYKGIAIGSGAKAGGENISETAIQAIAIGVDAIVGNGSHASVSIGSNSKTEKSFGVAIGYGSNSKKETSVALGTYSISIRDRGVSGYNPLTNEEFNINNDLSSTDLEIYNTKTEELKELNNQKEEYLKEISDIDEEIKSTNDDNTRRTLKERKKDIQDNHINPLNSAINSKTIERNSVISSWISSLGALSIGDEESNKTRQITNVAAGSKDTDAVNLAQLKALKNSVYSKKEVDEKLSNLDTSRFDKNTAGIASAMSMAMLPQINSSSNKKFNIAISYAYFKGESAYSLGLSGTNKNNNLVYKLSSSINSKSDIGLGIGIGYQFGEEEKNSNNRYVLVNISNEEELLKILNNLDINENSIVDIKLSNSIVKYTKLLKKYFENKKIKIKDIIIENINNKLNSIELRVYN